MKKFKYILQYSMLWICFIFLQNQIFFLKIFIMVSVVLCRMAQKLVVLSLTSAYFLSMFIYSIIKDMFNDILNNVLKLFKSLNLFFICFNILNVIFCIVQKKNILVFYTLLFYDLNIDDVKFAFFIWVWIVCSWIICKNLLKFTQFLLTLMCISVFHILFSTENLTLKNLIRNINKGLKSYSYNFDIQVNFYFKILSILQIFFLIFKVIRIKDVDLFRNFKKKLK